MFATTLALLLASPTLAAPTPPSTPAPLATRARPIQAVTQVDLESPGEADQWFTTAFGPQGNVAYLGHYQTGVITRMELPGPTPHGRITGSVEYGTRGGPIAISPNGSTLFAVDTASGDFHVIDAATLAVTGSIPALLMNASWLLVNEAGTSVVVVPYQGAPQFELKVVDTASLTVSQSLVLPSPLQVYPTSLQQPLFFADDDVTLVGVIGPLSAQRIVTYDTVTGVQTGSLAVAAGGGTVRELALSIDRTTAMVGYEFQVGSTVHRAWSKFDTVPLAALGDFDFGVTVSSAVGVVLDQDGTRATATLDGVVTDFPVTGTVHDPLDPSIVRFGGGNALGFLRTESGNRLARIAFTMTSALRMEVYDVAGTLLGLVDGAPFGGLGGVPFHVGMDDTMLLIDSASTDRVRSVDLSAAQGPYPITASINTGAGPEFDGPYAFVRVPGTQTLAVTAFGSNALKTVDARSGAVIADVATAHGPSALVARADGQLIVGHVDGTLLVMDPGTGAETLRLSLGQRIEEIVAEPTGAKVFVRLADEPLGPGPRILWVETDATAPGTLATIPISGGASHFAGFFEPRGNGTMWFDWDQGVAFVVSELAGTVEVVDLVSLAVTSVASIQLNSRNLSVIATSDASQVFVTTSTGTVRAFDTTGGLTESWFAGCPSSPFGAQRLALTDDDSTLFIDAAGGLPGIPCFGMGAYSTATGAWLDDIPMATGGVGGDAFGDDLLFWLDGQKALALTRFGGGSFGPLRTFSVQRPSYSSPHLLADLGLAVTLTTSDFSSNDPDGLAIVDLMADQVQVACTGGVPNATGVQATLSAGGSPFAGGTLVLRAEGLQPNSMFGMLIVGSQLVPPMPAGTGVGLLCVGGSVGRLTSQVQIADANGHHVYRLDSQSIGTSIGTIAVQPGETWAFQDWHRDSNPQGMATSNTSTALSVSFY